MSGLEVAGFVVSVIPVVVQALQKTALGCDSLRLFQSARFARKVRDWTADLTTQRARLLNNIILVVRATDILEYDEGKNFDDGVVPELLMDKALSEQLNKLLGHNSEPFRQTILRIQEALLEVEEKMGLRSDPITSSRSEDAKFWKERAHMAKMIFGQKVYQQLIADLKQANSDLDAIKAQIIELSASNPLTKQIRRPLARLRKLRENAKHLLLAVSDNWKCDCVNQHTLFLCPRQPVDDADFEFDLASTDPAPVYQIRTTELPLVSQQKDARGHTNGTSTQMQGLYLSSTKSSHLSLVTTSSNVSAKPVSRTKVTFKDANATSISVNTLVDDSDEINDLRRLSCTVQTGKSGDLAGHIKPRNSPFFRHDLFFALKNVSFNKAIPVGAACCNSIDCSQRGGIMCDLDNADRLSLAANLARNIFLLQGTWLEPSWSTDKFMIPCHPTNHPIVEEVHLAHNFGTSPLLTNAPNEPERLLEPLGMALIEILLGRHIATSPAPKPAPLSQQCTNIQSAPTYDAIQKLYKTYGRQPNSIGNAVRECISWSGPISKKGFDDPDFSSAAYEKVIWPLIENARIFEGK